MAIGGLREKTMGALRLGIHTVIIPRDNEPDLEDIDPTVRAALNFITTDHVDKILSSVLRCPASPEHETTLLPPQDGDGRGKRPARQQVQS